MANDKGYFFENLNNRIEQAAEEFIADNPDFSNEIKQQIMEAAYNSETTKAFWEKVREIV